MTALTADIDAALAATDDAVIKARAEAAYNRLNNTKLGRSQQEFDPNNLPNSVLKSDKARVPRTTAEQFVAAGLVDNPLVQLAALQPYDFSGVPGAADPAYRAATTEVALTPDIVAKAEELDGNPVAIYNWVHNTIRWQPTWGAIQDPGGHPKSPSCGHLKIPHP